MARIICVVFLVLLAMRYGEAWAQDIDISAYLELGEEAYVTGDYAAARGYYEAALSAGVSNAAAYVNMGHIHYQLQDAGRALLYYRRAQTLQPRMPGISDYLARIRLVRNDLSGEETNAIDSLAAITTPLLTQSELVWLTVISWWVLWGGGVFSFIYKHWQLVLRRLLAVIVFFSLVLGLLCVSRLYVEAYRPAAVVIVDRIAVMSGPGEDYLQIYDLYNAAEVRVLEHSMGWVRFILPDQRQGWLPETALEEI